MAFSATDKTVQSGQGNKASYTFRLLRVRVVDHLIIHPVTRFEVFWIIDLFGWVDGRLHVLPNLILESRAECGLTERRIIGENR
jgi:hypothetical protein